MQSPLSGGLALHCHTTEGITIKCMYSVSHEDDDEKIVILVHASLVRWRSYPLNVLRWGSSDLYRRSRITRNFLLRLKGMFMLRYCISIQSVMHWMGRCDYSVCDYSVCGHFSFACFHHFVIFFSLWKYFYAQTKQENYFHKYNYRI